MEMEKKITFPDFNKNRKRDKIISVLVFSIPALLISNAGHCDPASPEQIQRSQEILQEDKMLREKIGQEIKVFIEKVVVRGADDLSKEEINNLALPYLKRWLKESEVREFIGQVKEFYAKRSRDDSSLEINHQIKNSTLEIIVKDISR